MEIRLHEFPPAWASPYSSHAIRQLATRKVKKLAQDCITRTEVIVADLMSTLFSSSRYRQKLEQILVPRLPWEARRSNILGNNLGNILPREMISFSN